jgi:hypothetical protein
MLIPFFFFGIYTAKKKKNVPALLLALFFGYFVVFHVVLSSMIRHRMPVMPLFFILSALGLTETWQWWQSSRFRQHFTKEATSDR